MKEKRYIWAGNFLAQKYPNISHHIMIWNLYQGLQSGPWSPLLQCFLQLSLNPPLVPCFPVTWAHWYTCLIQSTKNTPVLYVSLMWNVVLLCVTWVSPSLCPGLPFNVTFSDVLSHILLKNSTTGYSSSSYFPPAPLSPPENTSYIGLSVYRSSPLPECAFYNAGTLPDIILASEYSKQGKQLMGI